MLPGLRKRAISIGKNANLGLLLLQEKIVQDSLHNYIQEKQEAFELLTKWVVEDTCPVLAEAMIKLYEVDMIWLQLHISFAEKHAEYHRILKEIMYEEKQMDEKRKCNDALVLKTDKLLKQLNKNPEKHMSVSSREEYDQAKIAKEKSLSNLKWKEERLSSLKYTQLRKSLCTLGDANQTLHETCLRVTDTQQKIVKILLPPRHMVECFTKTNDRGSTECAFLISRLANELQLPRPVSYHEKKAGFCFKIFPFFTDKELSHATSHSTEKNEKPPRPPLPTPKDLDSSGAFYSKPYEHMWRRPKVPPRVARSVEDMRNIGLNHDDETSHINPRPKTVSIPSPNEDYLSLEAYKTSIDSTSSQVSPYLGIWK